jgi:hypothetical protein
MDVVDLYLLNVRAYLPGGARDDVVAELRENIRSQIEDREEKLGRALAEEERIAILRAHGRPLLVAGAYRSDGRRLVLGREVIGPDLFPFYRLAVLGAAAITILILAFSGVAGMVEGASHLPLFRKAVVDLAVLVGLATLVFALVDARFRRTAGTWDPRKLPASKRIPVAPTTRRIQAGIQIVATLAFLWIWVAVNASPSLVRVGLSDLRLGPAWRLLYLGLVVSTVIALVTPVLTLVQPAWHRFRWLVSLFSSGAFIAFASASMWKGDWVIPASVLPSARLEDVCDGINRGFVFGLGLAIVITALVTVFEVVRGAWREYRGSLAG